VVRVMGMGDGGVCFYLLLLLLISYPHNLILQI